MTWPPRFLFHSGRLCLDFAHTGGEGKWAVFERLEKPGDLAEWLAACSLQLVVERVRPGELRAARLLRRAIWDGAQELLREGRLSKGVTHVIHEAAAAPDLVPVLRKGVASWADASTARAALASIARDAIALFGGEQRQRLRECRNPHCPLLFVDTSRPGRRGWCTMRRCGNLEKTSRYRISKKKTSRSTSRRSQ